jgi:hypothetical protein
MEEPYYSLFAEEVLERLPLIQGCLLRLLDNLDKEIITDLQKIFSELQQEAVEVRASFIQETIISWLSLVELIEQKKNQEKKEINELEKLWESYWEFKNWLLNDLSQNLTGITGILAKGECLLSLSQPTQIETKPVIEKELDVAKVILNKDVVQNLTHLETVLDSPDTYKLRDELRRQAETFLDLGELLEVADFVTVAQGAIAMPITNLATTQLIAQRLLTNWRATHDSLTREIGGTENDRFQHAEGDYIYELPTENTESVLVDQPINSQACLTTKDLFIWLSGFNLFLLPANSIQEMITAKPKDIISSESNHFFSWGGQLIPFYQLSNLITYSRPLPSVFTQSKSILVINYKQYCLALEIELERLIIKPQLNLKPFGNIITPPNYIPGCTCLENEQMVVVIDVFNLLDESFNKSF